MGRIRAALRRLLTDWIRAHPVPVEGNGGAGPAWETLSAAWRVLETEAGFSVGRDAAFVAGHSLGEGRIHC